MVANPRRVFCWRFPDFSFVYVLSKATGLCMQMVQCLGGRATSGIMHRVTWCIWVLMNVSVIIQSGMNSHRVSNLNARSSKKEPKRSTDNWNESKVTRLCVTLVSFQLLAPHPEHF